MGLIPFLSPISIVYRLEKYGRIQVHERNLAQEAIGNDALLAADSRLAVQKPEHHPPRVEANSPGEGTSPRLQSHSGIRCLQNPNATWWSQEARAKGSDHGQTGAPGCLRPVCATTPPSPKSVSVVTAAPFASSTRT